MTDHARMHRRLGLTDAVAIGAGSMTGAGVFSVWAPASISTPVRWLPVAVLVAALVALANAWSSARLAAECPVAGGSYVYGRELLGPWWGYAAGWCFVVGKMASCAAMAMTLAGSVLPGATLWQQRLIGATVVALLTVVNCLGVTRTAQATKAIVIVVLAVLTITVVVLLNHPQIAATAGPATAGPAAQAGLVTPYGIWQSAALIFFAFAGYARIATLGEEVRDPRRTIPRAIGLAFALVVVIYLAVALSLGRVFSTAHPRLPDWPLTAAAQTQAPWLMIPLAVAVALASAGALLNLMTGIGRTSLAMARERDLPGWLAALHLRTGVPHRAEIVLGLVVIAAVCTLDLRQAIGFSSFGVLLYYAVANLSAWRQVSRLPAEQRGLRAGVPLMGLVGCLTLVAALPLRLIVVGLVTLAVGLGVRTLVRRSMSDR